MSDIPLHEKIGDAAFRKAVDLMDAGDVAGLKAHLDTHPSLPSKRIRIEDHAYFGTPSLIEFIAENPVRRDRMPDNVVDVVRLLLEYGAEADAVQGTLVLVSSGRVARESGHQASLIAVLCAAGADPNGAMITALGHGELGAATALAEAGAQRTLPFAAAFDDVEAAQDLMNGATPDARHQAIALAAQLGASNTLRLLLAAGEDPNRYNPPNCHAHTTPLHQAVFYGHLDCVRLLVETGAETSLRDRAHDATPLDWARHAGHDDIAAYLVREAPR